MRELRFMDRWRIASLQVGDVVYGTRFSDLVAGCVFKTQKDGSGYTALHIFDGVRGHGPDGLVVVDGVLYGLTTWGGPDYRSGADGSFPGYGVLYRLNLDATDFEVVHNFSRTEGPSPRGSMVYLGGMLYGLTSETLFRIRPDGTDFATLHTFGTVDGSYSKPHDFLPGGGLTAANGILYGARVAGSRDRRGVIFSFDVLRGRLRTLHAFKGPEGRRPDGALILRSGMLYGMTEAGGRHDAGVVFQLPVLGGPIKILVDLDDALNGAPNALAAPATGRVSGVAAL
jgi:uncharacterized repeat protein (TIGR03803 family)